MLYGYLTAVIAGFLLTAVPNWTGRMPLQGKPLLVLVSAWGLGRIAVSVVRMDRLGPGARRGRVVSASPRRRRRTGDRRGRNWRNLKVLIVLGLLLVGNLIFHLEARLYGAAEYGARLGIAATIMLVMLIGGRIVPSFTRNWLARRGPGRPARAVRDLRYGLARLRRSRTLRLGCGSGLAVTGAPWSVQVCCRRCAFRWAGSAHGATVSS